MLKLQAEFICEDSVPTCDQLNAFFRLLSFIFLLALPPLSVQVRLQTD